MKILQTDVLETSKNKTVTFIDAMESPKYPIFALMYHPEYQMLKFLGEKRFPLSPNRKTVEEIGFRVSLHLNRMAR